MRGILADNDVQGQLVILLRIWQNQFWRQLWEDFHLSVYTFEDLGLDRHTNDLAIWQKCQAREVVLITGNRNDDGPDSLEATIRNHNTDFSLPVFTFADAKRLQHDRDYANKAAVQLLQYLLEIDAVRGTGRLFVP